MLTSIYFELTQRDESIVTVAGDSLRNQSINGLILAALNVRWKKYK